MDSNIFIKILGFLWALPVTVFGLIYAIIFWTLGWYSFWGFENVALVWTVRDDKAPKWLMKAWYGWGGHTIGSVVVLADSPLTAKRILRHEQEHVLQCMRLGIFQPIMYALNMLAVKIGCSNLAVYRGNPFEIDARIAADDEILPLER